MTNTDLWEMLDNVSAAAFNLLALAAPNMTEQEFKQRLRLIDDARAACDHQLRPKEAPTE